MLPTGPALLEWKRGWPVVVGAMACSGFGIPLFYYVVSLFLEGMRAEFGVSPGEMSNAQALIVVGALIAPVMGGWLDRFGFRRIFGLSALMLSAIFLCLGTIIDSFLGFAAMALLIGAIGVGCGPLAYTRPIAAWFWHSRGMALGLAAIGVAVTTTFIAPLLARLIAAEGWRAGFLALAVLTLVLCIPATLILMKEAPPEGPAGPQMSEVAVADRTHFRDRDFWLMIFAMLAMAIPGSGMISQIAPIVKGEGIDAASAAYGITAFAFGQVAGRIIAGWFLDHANPRIVGFLFTAVPAVGFVALAMFDLTVWGAVFAIAMVGVQQGAEIDLFAWFTARRYGFARYSGVYGWIIAASWIGNAAGILTFGWLRDFNGDYVIAEWVGALLLFAGGILIAAVRVKKAAAED